MEPRRPDTDVLISGAGPTGLTLALELAAQGVRCRIVDRAPARSDKSRALVVQARTLELLARHGLAAPLVEQGRRTMNARGFVGRREAFRVTFEDIGAEDTAYPFLLFVSQAETERVLEEALLARGVRVERPLELVAFREEGGLVRATLRGARDEELSARYLVGCDGAHSAVRHGLGLLFEGDAYPQDFILADLEIEWEGDGELRFFFGRDGLLVAFPFKEPGLYRLISSRPLSSADRPEPDLGEFQARMAALCPLPFRLESPRWMARFRLHHRGVDRYRVGRVFVAGDAAHIHSPAGGQGMNTGIQDAINLGWKLALALAGRGPGGLLDSYEAERLPVGRRLLQVTDRLFSLGASRNRALNALRDLLVPRVVPWVLASRRRRARAFRFISQLAIKYSKSPIVSEELSGADAAFREGPGAGQRAPDGPLRGAAGETTLHAEMRGARHYLLAFGGHPRWSELRALAEEQAGLFAPLAIERGAPAGGLSEGVYLDEAGLLHRRYGLSGAGCYLIRPDGYIAFRAPGGDLSAVRRFLVSWAPGVTTSAGGL